MSAFTQAVNDIFRCKDFLETCIIGSEVYSCICSAVANDVVYGDAGMIDDVSFQLAIKLPVRRMPKKGDKLIFRDVQYKVSSVEIDSAMASMNIRLQSLSKG